MLDCHAGEEPAPSVPLLADNPTSILPEVEVYLSLLVLMFLIDQKHYEGVS